MHETAQRSNAAAATGATTPTAITPLFVRPDQAIQLLSISRRCLGNWTAKKILPHYRISRCLMFRVSDLEAALSRYRISAVGEVKLRQPHVKTTAPTASEPKARQITTSPTTTITSAGNPQRKRRMLRTKTE